MEPKIIVLHISIIAKNCFFFFDKYFCKVSFVSIFASANKGTTVQNNKSLLSSLNEKK